MSQLCQGLLPEDIGITAAESQIAADFLQRTKSAALGLEETLKDTFRGRRCDLSASIPAEL